MTSDRDPRQDDQLYKTFYEGLPNHRSEVREGRLSVIKIARDMGISRQAVSSWFERGKISLESILRLVVLPGSTLTTDKIIAAMKR